MMSDVLGEAFRYEAIWRRRFEPLLGSSFGTTHGRGSMSDFVDATSGLPSRRSLIAAAAWSVPIVAVMTATPAFAASDSPSINALKLDKIDLSDLNAGGHGGPIGIDLEVEYSHASAKDPDTISFSWALTVSGPAGNGTVESGATRIAKYGTWKKQNLYYPDHTTNLPQGKYDFTLTVSVAGSGSRSSTRKIKI